MSLFWTAGEPAGAVQTTTGGVVLTLSCPDRAGIVHAVSGVLLELGYNIVESHEFHARRDGMFFMRVRAEQEGATLPDPAPLRDALDPVGARLGMNWRKIVQCSRLTASSRVSSASGSV